RGERTLEGNAILLDRIQRNLRQHVAMRFRCSRAGGHLDPFDCRTSRLQNLDAGCGNLRTDAVARNEADRLMHSSPQRAAGDERAALRPGFPLPTCRIALGFPPLTLAPTGLDAGTRAGTAANSTSSTFLASTNFISLRTSAGTSCKSGSFL